jgi:hypothetical protein
MAVRAANFMKSGDPLYLGHEHDENMQGIFEGQNMIPQMFQEVKETACFEERKKLIQDFNQVAARQQIVNGRLHTL